MLSRFCTNNPREPYHSHSRQKDGQSGIEPLVGTSPPDQHQEEPHQRAFARAPLIGQLLLEVDPLLAPKEYG